MRTALKSVLLGQRYLPGPGGGAASLVGLELLLLELGGLLLLKLGGFEVLSVGLLVGLEGYLILLVELLFEFIFTPFTLGGLYGGPVYVLWLELD